MTALGLLKEVCEEGGVFEAVRVLSHFVRMVGSTALGKLSRGNPVTE